MRVVAFNASSRKDGNTAILLRRVLDELEREDIAAEVVNIGGQPLRGCTGCRRCRTLQDGRCSRDDDLVNACIEKMRAADGILLGSPTYFSDVTTEMKALIDRCGFVAKSNGDLFRRKVGAAVVAVRRAGSIHAFDTMNHFFTINQMIVPGSSYWNVGVGLEKGDVEKDEEGLRTMKVLGENMAWLLKKVR
ncbi:flavodoxin family protein [Anaeromyxobacter oryzae]|uniref:Flavodoxin family protein n=1 Tax=Anaeromyxobacter oryzae TaxID=2918170 RepID=A0ABM7WSH6_9BACT|nr:flavodoxin family protein [Anaeromyxobacter oryzae]BDG02411.1 flavodoxin family protein [Anaeromyxobacter oryzae]